MTNIEYEQKPIVPKPCEKPKSPLLQPPQKEHPVLKQHRAQEQQKGR